MRIFYTGLENDRYIPKIGKSFEHLNFYLSLKNYPGAEVAYFPFDRILEVGKEKYNQELLTAVKTERPDLVFCFMLSDELDHATLLEMKKHTKTVAWFSDDHWRFHNYARQEAPYFSWVTTTYSKAVGWYKKSGYENVIRSQWGANPSVYKPGVVSNVPAPDVAFVGNWTKPRGEIVSFLEKNGVKVTAYGGGWPRGRASDDQMLSIFGSAKINLALNPAPGFLNKNSLGRLTFRRSVDKIVFDPHVIRNLECLFHRGIPQIKGRHFEIPACGGFLVTGAADDLETYYEPGKEIVIYHNKKELLEKVRYYLSHDAEREQIKKAAYERTMKDHTYQKRFEEIFKRIGL